MTRIRPDGVRRITRELLADLPGSRRALVTAAEPGVVAGIGLLDVDAVADPAGTWRTLRVDGDEVEAGDSLVEIVGSAWELAVAEDHVLGALGVAGGLAGRGLQLRRAAPPGLRVACGGWKKLPASLKPVLHAALDVAGITHRLIDGEFVYIDKNVVTLLDGIEPAVLRGRSLDHGPVAVQVVDLEQARCAVAAGCGIVMVDTGSLDDLSRIDDALRSDGMREQVQLAFAGGVTETDLAPVRAAGADIVDIGRAVLDAPLWDLRMEVVS
ncbi:MAG: nicotinate-nucleotide pyrophosphorylase [Ilumatobacteraceae bacterium]